MSSKSKHRSKRKLTTQDVNDFHETLRKKVTSYLSQDKIKKVKLLYIEALKKYRKDIGSEHQLVVSILNPLARIYESEGRYDKSKPLLLEPTFRTSYCIMRGYKTISI